MNCIKCGSAVPGHKRACDTCGTDCGFPNVRVAELSEEVLAISARVNDAMVSSDARKCKNVANQFVKNINEHSKAIIARPLAIIDSLISDPNIIYASFQKQVKAGLRNPQDNEFDKVREAYESALFPHFSDEIVFASLTLKESGMSGYGTHAFTLKTEMIEDRATLFEENPHNFVEKHRVILNKPIPKGFRTIWTDRGMLALAKLHSRLKKDTTIAEFPDILETDNGGSGDSDWIEVHIYGVINRNAIESVSGPVPKTREDKVIWKALIARSKAAGIEVHEI